MRITFREEKELKEEHIERYDIDYYSERAFEDFIE